MISLLGPDATEKPRLVGSGLSGGLHLLFKDRRGVFVAGCLGMARRVLAGHPAKLLLHKSFKCATLNSLRYRQDFKISKSGEFATLSPK